MLFIAIGLFLSGIVMFCGALGNFSSARFKSYLKVSNNRFAGLGVGMGATTVIQSSTAIVVMVVGLVNVGVLSLFQASSIIIGANVGATLTGLLISFSGFNIKYAFMLLVFVGALLKLFARNNRTKMIADFFMGLGIMFVGLELMNIAFDSSPWLQNFFASIFQNITFPFLLLLVGILLTCIIQSSMATLALLICMMGCGIIGLNQAIYIIMGANIGMCLAVYLASLKLNTKAKQAAVIHFLFNAIGALFFTVIFSLFSTVLILPFERLDPMWQLSIFNIAFNVATAVLLVGFIRPIIHLSTAVIKDKKESQNYALCDNSVSRF